jgi:short-subunit dehydrogenase
MAIRACLGEKKPGVICLVASTAGIRGNYLASLYCASKHAIVGFAKSMAECDPEEGIRVVCICPGLVATRLWTDREPEFMEMNKYSERPALGPEHIAQVMVKMIENLDREYEGGTVVLKTPLEERILEKGWNNQEGVYDPSPRPQADLGRMKGILEKERGVDWSEGYQGRR